ncbi:MAG: hypothetical protein EOP91_05075 [Lysobacteraceae bacterium]|nr:MAG: hypothetical protein EOP91_05075 [Xanthomonadaceae bacterium]
MNVDFVVAVLLPRLLSASLQSLLVVAVVLLLCRSLPRLSPSARAGLWWLASLQLVVGLLWSSPLSLAWLPADALQSVSVPVAHAVELPAPVGSPLLAAAPPALASPATATPAAWSWPMALAWAWVLGLAWMLARTLRGYQATRQLLRRSLACGDASLLQALQLAASAHGLRASPRLRLSRDIESPQLVGPWRPVLLLPADYLQSMRDDELDMALTHELVHLQRGDLWWGMVPALAQHLFFFHPLAHLGAREYGLAREASCDAAVIAGNRHCARDYGRLLIRLGVAARPSAGLASASPTFRILKRRLVMLQHTASLPRVVALAILGLVAVVGVVPYRLTAAPAIGQAAAPRAASAAVPATARVAPVAPEAGATPAAIAPKAVAGSGVRAAKVPASPASKSAPMPPLPAVPPPPHPNHAAPPAPPAPPAASQVPAPPAPPAPPPRSSMHHDGGGFSYVVLQGDHTYARGSSADMREAQRQRRGNEELMWLRKGEVRYVVRDPAILKKMRTVHDEMTALGDAQMRLGERQAQLGGQQGELGGRQAEIGAQLGHLSVLQAQQSLALAAGRVATTAPQARSEEKFASLQARQQALSRQMEALSVRQQALGREQAALGLRQTAASERASRQAAALVEQAVASGAAQLVKR